MGAMAPAYVADGGLETDLIFRRGVDLPHFAAFPLVGTPDGEAHLRSYYDDYADIAASGGHGLVLESPTWRANPDWGHLLGYGPGDLDRVNTAAVVLLADLRARYSELVRDVVVSGSVGPRYDAYSPDASLEPDDAAAYHRPQLAAFAAAGADRATAYTLTNVGEAVGIVRAAREVGLPVVISFTVETDGRLPSGTTLAQAVRDVDAAAAPDDFGVNCAHPTHVAGALTEPGAWLERITVLRTNASTASHAELDEATELDDGDPEELAAAHARLIPLLPRLSVLGGCCGTDARHVAVLARTVLPSTGRAFSHS